MAKTQYAALMQELKRHLKRSKLSYARLAGLLDIPESTLKKWFTASDGSFSRLSLLCETLGVSLHALLKAIEEEQVRTLTFQSSQQSLFMKDPMAFRVYWFLVYERLDEEVILARLKLKPSEFKAALFKLDKVNLIHLGKEDKVRLPKMKPVRWNFEGEFLQKLLKEWTTDIIQDAQLTADSNRLVLQYFQLSPKSAEEFLKDLAALEEKFARRTINELSTISGPRKQIRYLLSSAEGSFIK